MDPEYEFDLSCCGDCVYGDVPRDATKESSGLCDRCWPVWQQDIDDSHEEWKRMRTLELIYDAQDR